MDKQQWKGMVGPWKVRIDGNRMTVTHDKANELFAEFDDGGYFLGPDMRK